MEGNAVHCKLGILCPRPLHLNFPQTENQESALALQPVLKSCEESGIVPFKVCSLTKHWAPDP